MFLLRVFCYLTNPFNLLHRFNCREQRLTVIVLLYLAFFSKNSFEININVLQTWLTTCCPMSGVTSLRSEKNIGWPTLVLKWPKDMATAPPFVLPWQGKLTRLLRTIPCTHKYFNKAYFCLIFLWQSWKKRYLRCDSNTSFYFHWLSASYVDKQ